MKARSEPVNDREMRDLAASAAREAGDWLLTRFGGGVATVRKGDDSVVTEMDVASERMIVERIRARYPQHTIVGEEGTPGERTGARSWAVDPIDGTRNYAAALPLWAVSIAALEAGTPAAAAIYLPVTGEMYRAARGQGAWVGEAPLRVGTARRLADAVVATDAAHGGPADVRGEILGWLVVASRRTRMFGSVCCALAWVAAGRLDLYYAPRANLWDMAAGALLVREAGGEVRTHDGAAWTAGASSIVAGNATLVAEFLAARHGGPGGRHPAPRARGVLRASGGARRGREAGAGRDASHQPSTA